MATSTEIKDGKLIITMDLDETGQRSASGKTMVHASTRGNITTGTLIKGKPLVLGVNCYTK